MYRVLRRSATALLVAALAACVGHGAAGSAVPTMIGRDQPDFSYRALRPTEMRADVSVMVDPDGRPDMSTLRITGTATVDQRAAISEWIARTVFDPAKRDGAPVRAEYRTSIRSRLVARPVSR